MNLLPKSSENFSQKEYWESFFKKRGTKAFEWYGEFQELCTYIYKYINKTDKILMIGCGNSTLSMDMYDKGFDQITNIDISTTVIKQMEKKNTKRHNLKFLVMNALQMEFNDELFNIAFDKGTLDALMTDDSEDANVRVDNLFQEINRVMKPNGRYICVSLLQEHILRKLLEFFTLNKWNIMIERCIEAEQKAVDRGEIGMPTFVIICSKTKKKEPTLELSIAGEVQKIKNIETMIQNILCMQQAVQVVSGLNNSNIAGQDEIYFELFKPGNEIPRYTIYILDSEMKRKHYQYAAFIVPQGRETEWLFSTKQGRKKLLEQAGHNRLAIVTMHRGQKYDNLEQVKEELNDHIKNLAPPGLKTKISYLSLGTEVGKREVKFKGNSEISGPFIIEDSLGDNDETYRRLIFLETQNIIQSEAKLKLVKSGRRGNKKFVVDHSYISCEHHIFMSLGAHISCPEGKGEVALIGVGGGALCMFLKQLLPQTHITAIDIDDAMIKVATEYFGLITDNIDIKIEDGLKFIEETAKNGTKYNAILFDVDSKDTTLGMSCPPKEFLEENVLENVQNGLTDEGVFILNLVLRDENLRPGVLKTLKNKFKYIVSYKLDQDLNEIFYCQNVNKNDFTDQFSNAVSAVNGLCQKKKIQNEELDLKDMMESLKIN